jgi:uncharacterized HAD superfamily protein
MENDEKLKEIYVDGEKISPVLPEDVKNYLIDIDGTICDDIPNEEPHRMKAQKTIKKWFAEGHIITFFTSRTEEHRKVTEDWLKQHNFPFHGIIMGKPRGGNYHWIDNHIVRATRYSGTFSDLVKKNVSIEVFENS